MTTQQFTHHTPSLQQYLTPLKQNLKQDLHLPGGSALLQYVDDLMICSPSKQACETDTKALLAANGHKVSLSKLQRARQKVTYLGHVITPEGKSLSQMS